jgi:glycoside/pentoside/hexuronide:cation symporter, GPH family
VTAATTFPATRGAGLPIQIGYGAGQIAGQVFRDLPSLLLLFFMTTVLGIAPDLAGIVIFVPKLVLGLLCDVSVGIVSDKLRRKFARRWWLLAGVLLSPLAMVLLFHVPEGSQTLKLAYVGVMFSFYMIVFASFSVPYLALAGELTRTPEERNHLMAWRLVFTAVGVLVAGALAPYLVALNGGDQAAYESMALVLAVICPLSLLIAFFSTRTAGGLAAGQLELANRLTPAIAFAKIFRTRFAPLLFANLLQLTGAGMGYAALIYFLAYNMGLGVGGALQNVSVIVLMACAGIIIAQPFWIKAAGALGKRNAYILATFMYLATYVVWGMSAGWGVEASYVLSFTAALGNSGWAMLGFSMMCDVAAEDEEYAGLYSAAWIASDKIAFALGGTLLVGLILSAFGFDSAAAVAGAPQPATAATGIVFAFAFFPVCLNLLAALLLWRFGKVGLKA